MMKYHAKRIIIFTLGILFIALGIAGLALPFLQGFLFLAIGILLLSVYSPSLREWMQSHTRRWPKLHEMVLKVEAGLIKIIGEP